MSRTNLLPTSRIGLCCRVLLGIVVSAIILRCTVFFGPWGEGGGLSTAYMLCTWPPLIVLFCLEACRLRSYLQRHHPQKWEEFTAGTGLSFGKYNARGCSWLYSLDDLGDPAIARMKKDQILFVALVLAVFFSYPILCVLLTYAPAG